MSTREASSHAQRATVTVPATSANLGPGYDCLGVALDLRDEYHAELSTQPGVWVHVTGEGADTLPRDHTNLVASSFLRCFEHLGDSPPVGVDIHCRNAIPHGRGMGSSSAATVGGLALGRAMSLRGDELPDYALLEFATELEGHPDNVAPAVYGGFTISWVEKGVGRAVRLQPHPEVVPVMAVSPTPLSTAAARDLMPTEVPLADAIFNVTRASLLCHALTVDPELLLPATADALHQNHRAAAYPGAHQLVTTMREHGRAALVSGAGPSVLALAYGDPEAVADDLRRHAGSGWDVRILAFTGTGIVVT